MLTNAHQMDSNRGVPFEGRLPVPKRRRRPLIDLAAIDAKAKAENAEREKDQAEVAAAAERIRQAQEAEREREKQLESERRKTDADAWLDANKPAATAQHGQNGEVIESDTDSATGQQQTEDKPATGGRRRAAPKPEE